MAGISRLTAGVPAPTLDEALAAEVLGALELAAPGDTALRLEPGGHLLGTRTLVDADPGTAADAQHELDRLVAHAASAVTDLRRALDEAAGTEVAAPDGLGRPSPWVASLVATVATVRTPQPGWPTPDGSGTATVTLTPGTCYQILDRAGDWAHVRGEDGTLCFTDGRTLVGLDDGGSA